MRISAFAKHYNTVLEDAPDEEIVLERTGGKAPWVVTPMRLAEGNMHAVQVVAQVLRRALDDAAVSSRVVEGLADEYPWSEFLPADEQRVFAEDAVKTLRACAAVGKFTAYEDFLDSWRATAEVHADPVLAAKLQGRLDLARIPVPDFE